MKFHVFLFGDFPTPKGGRRPVPHRSMMYIFLKKKSSFLAESSEKHAKKMLQKHFKSCLNDLLYFTLF